MATIKKFEDIEVWQLARKLCKLAFQKTKKKEFSKDFALTDQVRRSSGSVMDNIAEGFGRSGNREFIQFLSISNGSANEFKSQMYRALDYEYINEEEFNLLYENADIITNKPGSFIQYLKSTEIKGEKFKKTPSAN